jgi:hypothetical protein
LVDPHVPGQVDDVLPVQHVLLAGGQAEHVRDDPAGQRQLVAVLVDLGGADLGAQEGRAGRVDLADVVADLQGRDRRPGLGELAVSASATLGMRSVVIWSAPG